MVPRKEGDREFLGKEPASLIGEQNKEEGQTEKHEGANGFYGRKCSSLRRIAKRELVEVDLSRVC